MSEFQTATHSVEQRRAAHALNAIEELAKQGHYGNYLSYIDAFPAAIVMNSLGQAAATLLAQSKGKAKDAHRLLFDHLQAWLCGSDPAAPYPDGSFLLHAITEKDQKRYFRAQAEALAYLVWLKKFARALLEPGDSFAEE